MPFDRLSAEAGRGLEERGPIAVIKFLILNVARVPLDHESHVTVNDTRVAYTTLSFIIG